MCSDELAAPSRERRLVPDADLAVSVMATATGNLRLCGGAAYAALDLGAVFDQLLQDHP